MKYALLILLAFGLFSCEKDKVLTGVLKLNATYIGITLPVVTKKRLPDNGAIVYIYNINFASGASKVDYKGDGKVVFNGKTLIPDKSIILDSQGMGEISLIYGTYGTVCQSNNSTYGNQMSWYAVSLNLDNEVKTYSYDFPE